MLNDQRPRLLTPPPGFETRQGAGFLVHADRASDGRAAFAFAVARGLEQMPRRLPSRYLYDDHGSYIFDKITEQPEYYQTRTEDGLLAANAATIRDLAGDATIVELGSGSSAKTRNLLDAWLARGAARYVPIDVSTGALEPACRALAARSPALTVEGLAASYERGLSVAHTTGPLMLVFLGSTIGNFERAETDAFLSTVSERLAPGDFFLLGIDLVKDVRRLEAAYNDAALWSERFQKNLIARMNRELGTRVPLEALEYVGFYNDRAERVEMYLRFTRDVAIDLPLVGRSYRVARGEMVLTEISRKFRVAAMADDASRFGMGLVRLFQDPQELFAVLLLRRRVGLPAAIGEHAAIEDLLRRTRQRTLEIISPLGDEDLMRQHSSLMSPLAWDIGHIGAYEQLWLVDSRGASADRPRDVSGAGDGQPVAPGAGEGLPPIFDPLIQARPDRGHLPLPSRGELLASLGETRLSALAGLNALPASTSPSGEDLFVYSMVAQHEAQHQETMLAALALRDDLVYLPPFLDAPPLRPAHRPVGEMVLVPEGPFLMGTDDRRHAFDNERPRHEVSLPAYRIGATAVSNGEYLRFMEDGGYRRPELWTREGWAWREETEATAPGHWKRVDEDWAARIFGRWMPIDADRPVIHVCWYEADAYARWAGLRLPTEAEWEKAAAWNLEALEPRLHPWGDAPVSAERANLDQRLLDPAPVGSYPAGRSFYGCHAMIGDVWEWTSTWFRGYPGFTAFPYREYSEIFFGTRYRVLRGGSWATPRAAIRNTFRNWDFPERRQIFSGFRCAQDE